MAFVQQWVACATANATNAGMVTASRKLVAGAADDGNTGATGHGMEWAGQYEEHVNQREEHSAGGQGTTTRNAGRARFGSHTHCS